MRTTLNTVLEALLQDVPGIDAAVALAAPTLPVRWCDAIQQRIGEALATDPSLQFESTAEMVGSALPAFGAPPSVAASAIVAANPVDADSTAAVGTALATAGGAALLQPIVLSTQRMSNLHLATVQEAVTGLASLVGAVDAVAAEVDAVLFDTQFGVPGLSPYDARLHHRMPTILHHEFAARHIAAPPAGTLFRYSSAAEAGGGGVEIETPAIDSGSTGVSIAGFDAVSLAWDTGCAFSPAPASSDTAAVLGLSEHWPTACDAAGNGSSPAEDGSVHMPSRLLALHEHLQAAPPFTGTTPLLLNSELKVALAAALPGTLVYGSRLLSRGFALTLAEWHEAEGGAPAITAQRATSFLAACVLGGQRRPDASWAVSVGDAMASALASAFDVLPPGVASLLPPGALASAPVGVGAAAAAGVPAPLPAPPLPPAGGNVGAHWELEPFWRGASGSSGAGTQSPSAAELVEHVLAWKRCSDLIAAAVEDGVASDVFFAAEVAAAAAAAAASSPEGGEDVAVSEQSSPADAAASGSAVLSAHPPEFPPVFARIRMWGGQSLDEALDALHRSPMDHEHAHDGHDGGGGESELDDDEASDVSEGAPVPVPGPVAGALGVGGALEPPPPLPGGLAAAAASPEAPAAAPAAAHSDDASVLDDDARRNAVTGPDLFINAASALTFALLARRRLDDLGAVSQARLSAVHWGKVLVMVLAIAIRCDLATHPRLERDSREFEGESQEGDDSTTGGGGSEDDEGGGDEEEDEEDGISGDGEEDTGSDVDGAAAGAAGPGGGAAAAASDSASDADGASDVDDDENLDRLYDGECLSRSKIPQTCDGSHTPSPPPASRRSHVRRHHSPHWWLGT